MPSTSPTYCVFMRNAFHQQLDLITEELTTMAQMVQTAVQQSTTALLTADRELAEQVISTDPQIDQLQRLVEEQTFDQLARQQPVASDLRILVATLRIVAELERMGDLAEHVAKVARMRYPDIAVPRELRPTFAEMGELARRMVGMVRDNFVSRDVTAAEALMVLDDKMDALRSSIFRVMLADDWADGVEPAVDAALLGRYYERIADHAVSTARRVIYLATGSYPEDDDSRF
jgi:phosphate transport system protein